MNFNAARLLRITLALLLSCAAGSSFAYTATATQTFNFSGVGTFADPTTGCIAVSNTGAGAGYAKPWCSQLLGTNPDTSTYGRCRTPDTAPCNYNTSITWSGSIPTYSCPGGGTLSGSTCTCGAGESDTGSACVVACSTAGTTLGVRNLTIGWALSPVTGTADYVAPLAVDTVLSTPQCVQDGANMCSATVDLAATQADSTLDAYRSQEPSANGLYRISADYVMKASGGSTCTPSGSADPASAAMACPTGNVGTVNGKPVCLGTMPVAGINFGADGEHPGNPRAGTSNTVSSAAREPSTAAGGGPDARGGPDVTRGMDGSVGTGADRVVGSGGAGSAPGVDFPTDYQRDATGQTTNTKLQTIITDGLKIKETGTPTSGDFTASNAALDAAKTEAVTGLGTVTSATGKATSWGWSMSLPTGCTPLAVDMRVGGIGQIVSLDPCEFQDVIHELLSMIWAATTVFMVFGMVGRTLREV